MPTKANHGPSIPSKVVTYQLSDHQLLLLFSYPPAFALKNKGWSKSRLYVKSLDYNNFVLVATQPEKLFEIGQSDESIQNLVLGEDEKRTLQALAARQSSERKSWAADFIEGKGTGQIILLHG